METYNGHVRSPQDAILLFEACRIGLLPRVQRRLSEKERQQIKSGSVFVWDEREAGMRRWTDGKSWSASRVSGSFLTYREMEGKRGGNSYTATPAARRPSAKSPDGSATGDSEEGEGPDGYRYKPDGLMKQSFSITTSAGQHLHLISYYCRSHPVMSTLQQPTTDPQLRHIRPPKNLYPESSVNETASVPAVTRGPMPGSPYAAAPHQMGSASPYSRPGAQTPSYAPVAWPPTPNGTPPYQYAVYPPGASPIPYGHPIAYVPYPHPQGPTPFDRPAPPLSNPNMPYPPPPHHMVVVPGYPQHPAQHIAHPPQRALQATEVTQHQMQGGGYPHAPYHAAPVTSAPSEPPPVLPAINGASPLATRPDNKPPTPQPADSKSQESLKVRDAQGAPTINTASPARTIPSVGALLNNNLSDAKLDGKSAGGHSRSGSRSPNSSQRPPQEIPGDRLASNSMSADSNAITRLNSALFAR